MMMMNSDELKEFLLETMSMTGIYQPVIIRELLMNNGNCTKDQLAISLISHDKFYLDKFRKIVMR